MSQLRAAIYCRVSTREQADEGISLDFQKHLCREAALKAGATFVEEFVDEGFSGTVWERPRLQEFLSRLDEFDTLYVFRLDRLSRSIRDWANIMAALSDHNVGFVSITEKFDFSSPFGKAMMAMLAVFAELFVDILRENVKAAFTERTRQGLHNGRAPIGYKRTGDPREPLQADVDAVPYVHALFTRYAAGDSMATLAHELRDHEGKQHQTNAVSKVLRSPVYIGQVRHRGEVYEGAHEPIIDAELWHQCQRRLQENQSVPASARSRSLSPVYRCGLCGGRVDLKRSGDDDRAYGCAAYRQRRVTHERNSITVQKADALTWQVVREIIGGGVLREAVAEGKRKAKRSKSDEREKLLQAEHAELGKRVAFAYRAQAEGALDLETLMDVNRPLVQRREAIERELRLLRVVAAPSPAANLTLRQVEAIISTADVEAQRRLLKSIFERVEIHPGRLVYVSSHPSLQPLQVAVPAYYAPQRNPNLNLCFL